MYKGLIVVILATLLQSCASGPGKPGEAPLTQPSAQPSNDYMYRSPPPAVANALR
jgi:hypothetical protein